MSLTIKGKLSRKLSVEGGTSKAGKEWKKQSFLIDVPLSMLNFLVNFPFADKLILCILNQVHKIK